MLSLAALLLPTASALVMPAAGIRSAAAQVAAPQVNMMAGKKISDKNVWVSFCSTKDLRPGEAISGFRYGQEIAIACTKGGAIYAMSNKLPPTGQPATLGNVFDDVIVEPLTNTAFSLKTGKVSGPWCPSPLGKLIFGRLIAPQDVPVYKVRKQGGSVQVLINVNARAQFESNYWRGILDSQGKVDGGYY